MAGQLGGYSKGHTGGHVTLWQVNLEGTPKVTQEGMLHYGRSTWRGTPKVTQEVTIHYGRSTLRGTVVDQSYWHFVL